MLKPLNKDVITTGSKKKNIHRVPSLMVPQTKEISPPRIEFLPAQFPGFDMENITPQVVAEFISRQDEFYTPHRDNPFIARFKDAGIKLVGSIRENWNAWFELPSPSRALTPPATPCTPDDSSIRVRPLHLNVRRCHSLPGSPTMTRKEFDRFHDSSAPSKRTHSVLTSVRKLEEEFTDESFECRSDSSSNDSALGLDIMLKDFRSLMLTPHGHMSRKFSVEPSMLNNSVDRYRSRSELLALRESSLRGDVSPLRVHPAVRDRPRSWLGEDVFCSTSSSESCISMEDAFVMSPSSSYSSYSDLDSELFHLQSSVQLDLYQTRLHSRERFQELVKVWETKDLSKTPPPPGANRDNVLPAFHTPTFRPRCFWSCTKESCDYYMERVRKFQELKRKWEAQQLSTTGSDGSTGTLKPDAPNTNRQGTAPTPEQRATNNNHKDLTTAKSCPVTINLEQTASLKRLVEEPVLSIHHNSSSSSEESQSDTGETPASPSQSRHTISKPLKQSTTQSKLNPDTNNLDN